MGFFFLFSTVIVGQILARGISIYVNDIIGEDINVKLLESTTFVSAARGASCRRTTLDLNTFSSTTTAAAYFFQTQND